MIARSLVVIVAVLATAAVAQPLVPVNFYVMSKCAFLLEHPVTPSTVPSLCVLRDGAVHIGPDWTSCATTFGPAFAGVASIIDLNVMSLLPRDQAE